MAAVTCDVSNLRLTLVPILGGPGPASESDWYEISNTGHTECTLDGYPAMSFTPPLPGGRHISHVGEGPRVVHIAPGRMGSFSAGGTPPFASPFDVPSDGGVSETVTIWLPGGSAGLAFRTQLNLSFAGGMYVGAIQSGPPQGRPGSSAALNPSFRGAIVLQTHLISS